jgi:D-xylono/L-arabinono-1,4-lactonase
MKKTEVQLLSNQHCSLGENPLWHPEEQAFYWEEINNGFIYRLNADTDRPDIIYDGELLGGFTFQKEGGYLLFRKNEISYLNPDGSIAGLIQNIDPKMDRFNDVIADPMGRVFAGTQGKNNEGALFLINPDKSIKLLFRGTDCSNGMGFNTACNKFYWTNTTTGTIYRFNYDISSGALSNQEVFLKVPLDQGYLDGLVVDSQNCIWSARWGGSAVYRYSLEGKELMKINVPVEKVSSLCFGGKGLNEIFITTAGGQIESNGPEGSVYTIKVDVTGQVENLSEISTD